MQQHYCWCRVREMKQGLPTLARALVGHFHLRTVLGLTPPKKFKQKVFKCEFGSQFSSFI